MPHDEAASTAAGAKPISREAERRIVLNTVLGEIISKDCQSPVSKANATTIPLAIAS
jgi:hypothetical protein